MKYNTYHISTFGCQMNSSDSERIAGQLRSLGCSPVEKEAQADIIVYNTCCVRESAETRIYGRLGRIKRLKTLNPELMVIVAGCLAQKDQETIVKKAPHVDMVLGTQNIDRLADILRNMSNRMKDRIISDTCATDGIGENGSLARQNQVSAWVPIMFGCNNYCSYCIVPYVRGQERSRPAALILDEIQKFTVDGGKEITFLGQNVNSYASVEDSGWDFPRLLSAANQVERLERIRFMTSHPKDLSDRLIEVLAQRGSICEHIHLPVQSGSDEILQRMNRRYTTADYMKLVEKIRQVLPDISITTDFIVGFPGESDAAFAETLSFVKTIQFDASFTFLYSRRSGTPAAIFENQVAPAIKNERLRTLMDMQNEISLSRNQAFIGKSVSVLVDGPSKNNPQVMSGRTRCSRLVLWPANANENSGEIKDIRIASAQTFLLKGESERIEEKNR